MFPKSGVSPHSNHANVSSQYGRTLPIIIMLLQVLWFHSAILKCSSGGWGCRKYTSLTHIPATMIPEITLLHTLLCHRTLRPTIGCANRFRGGAVFGIT